MLRDREDPVMPRRPVGGEQEHAQPSPVEATPLVHQPIMTADHTDGKQLTRRHRRHDIATILEL
jgi:hypothetical protein